MTQAKNTMIVLWIIFAQIGHLSWGRFGTQSWQQYRWLQGESNTLTSFPPQILHIKRWDRYWFSISISHIGFCSSPCSSSLILCVICCSSLSLWSNILSFCWFASLASCKACWFCCKAWSFSCTLCSRNMALCSRDMDFFWLLSRALSFIFMSSSNLTTIKQFCYTRCKFFFILSLSFFQTSKYTSNSSIGHNF